MDYKLRITLIDNLLKVPACSLYEGRTSLISCIQDYNSLNRCNINARVDITLIIDQLFRMDQTNNSSLTNERKLLVFIDNALTHIPDTDIYEQLNSARNQIINTIHAITPLPYQLPAIYNFDLEQLIDSCINHLLCEKGLVGFAIPCHSSTQTKIICERLKEEIGRNNLHIKPSLIIQSSHTSLDKAMLTIGRYKPLLSTVSIVFDVHIYEETLVNLFWHRLCDEFTGSFNNNLIIIMAYSSNCVNHQRLFEIPLPQFTDAHLFRWIHRVVNYLQWPESVVQFWLTRFIAECKHENNLHSELVYEHLDETLKILQKNPTSESFCEFVEERYKTYASPSH